MRSRRALITLCGVLAVGMVGCAPQAEPDWAAAEAAAQQFEGEASAKEGFLGSGTFRLGGEGSRPSDENEIVLFYPDGVRVDGVTAACFGGGTSRVSLAIRVGSSWTGNDAVEIECDGTERAASLDDPVEAVNAVRANSAHVAGAGGVLVAVVSGSDSG